MDSSEGPGDLRAGVGGQGVMEFRGRLKALSCADILDFLRVLNRPGLLSLSCEGAAVGLYLRDGRIVQATSSRDADRLPELLVRWGLITSEQHDLVMRRAAAGERVATALVDGGALSPRELLEARRRRVAQIAVSLFEWEEGEFAFAEGEAPADEGVVVDLSIGSVLLEGIRSVRNTALFRQRMPFDDWIFEPIPGAEAQPGVSLDPHEIHVLRLVDGTRSLGEIGALSEFGKPEALRTLFLLFILGCLKVKGPIQAESGGPAPSDGLDGILARYNDMFGLVYQYLMREVGPISDHLLGRVLRDLEGSHPGLFHRASLGGDGTVDEGLLMQNLQALAGRPQRDSLIAGLNELLYGELLVLRKTLGAQHEGRILRALKDARLAGPRAGGPA
jgi:hypothetical protein